MGASITQVDTSQPHGVLTLIQAPRRADRREVAAAIPRQGVLVSALVVARFPDAARFPLVNKPVWFERNGYRYLYTPVAGHGVDPSNPRWAVESSYRPPKM